MPENPVNDEAVKREILNEMFGGPHRWSDVDQAFAAMIKATEELLEELERQKPPLEPPK